MKSYNFIIFEDHELDNEDQIPPVVKFQQPKVIEYDFSKVPANKPSTTVVETNKPIKVEFDANDPYKTKDKIKKETVESDHSSSIKKRVDTDKSLPSDMAPPTPPFSIRNKDLVHSHWKHRTVVSKLDFSQLNKKKRSKSK